MKIISASAAAALWLGLTIGPASAADPKGLWLTADGDAKIRIVTCGAALCGTIVWLKEPNDPATGQRLADRRNPDKAKRKRPLVGIAILLNMAPNMAPNGPEQWAGPIYNSDDGSTYQGKITLLGPAALRVEGCLLAFCGGENWSREN